MGTLEERGKVPLGRLSLSQRSQYYNTLFTHVIHGVIVAKPVSIILPTYNEKDNILDLIGAILETFSHHALSGEIIVVDDDSPDGTGNLVEDTFASEPRVRVIIRKGERGLATALYRGIGEAHFDRIVFMDTDFNHNPKDIPKLLEKLSGYDLAIGSRYVKGGGMETSPFRYWGSYAFNLFIRALFFSPIRDHLSGFWAFNKKHLAGFNLQDIFFGYGDYAIRFLYHAQKNRWRIVEIPVVYNFRHGGESKTHFLTHTVQYLNTVLKLRFVGLK
jgi:dolichol-phosphate mannosyltransferase